MSLINTCIGIPLGWLMWLCYKLVKSYGIAILLFTLLSKIILLPLSVVVQKNSIKMIRLQPEINRITAKHYGDKDTISDETIALYKREKYSPLLGMVPMIIQIILVLGLINVIYNPMQHLLRIDAATCKTFVAATAQLLGVDELGSGAQLKVIEAMRNGDHDIEKMRDEYDGRRRYLVEGLRRIGLECFEPKGAFYVFPSIKSTGLSSDDFCERFLLEEKVAVISGAAFGPGGEGFVRCCYAASMKDLAEALTRMDNFLTTLRKKQARGEL